jgi:ATP-dependent exoDNAse (exonuclease V) beta subunit
VDRWDALDDTIVDHCATLYRLASAVGVEWEQFQHDENMRDFDALILDCRRLLAREELAPALYGIRRRFGLFIIDEFQDTDGAQRDIAFRIAGIDGGGGDEPGPQLFVVGDPKQSIYGFRGADISVWNEVQEALQDGREPLALTRNFRSEPEVVEYVNRVCAPLLRDMGQLVEQHGSEGRVDYAALTPARKESEASQVEWLVSGGKAEERRKLEAKMVAARIRDIVVDPSRGDTEGSKIVDPDTGELRDCSYRDIAILFRARTGIEHYEAELQHYGAPYYLTGDAGLIGRLEVLDVLTLLRLIENPLDDLRAFAYLRSPFVGLRDEVIARIRLTARGTSLLRQAKQYLDQGDWFDAPEHADVSVIEREALDNGLRVIDDLTRLRSRVPIDRLVEEALDRTGYRLHLLLLEQPKPRLANLQRFIRILEDYRTQTVGTFLEIWARWEGQDLGVPQAPLYSKKDDVVTLSTIHGAKGLEWPVVFLVDNERGITDRKGGTVWSDRVLGPILCPKQEERGPRAKMLAERAKAEERAEEARLIYVATTRARDRLVIAGALDKPKEVTKWLARGRDDSVRLTQNVPQVDIPPLPPEPSLEWLDGLSDGGALPSLTHPVPTRRIRFTQSATELMSRGRNREEWRLKYHHGVIPCWYFARDGTGGSDGGGGLGARTRGIVIHGVLERIQEEEELAELLDVVIGTLDAPELEEHMAPGSAYRRQLEQEIRGVVSSDEWRWYIEGEHYRELDFVQFRTPEKWRIGAFDLYRPADPTGLIVDFKTQDVTSEEAERVARKYRAQAAMYRVVAGALGQGVEMRFHFTRPNAVVKA